MEHVLSRMRWWGDRPVLLLACAALLVALALSAADEIEAAATAAKWGIALLLVQSIVAVYAALPRDRRSGLSSPRTVRRISILSLVCAVTVACSFWYGNWVVGVEWPAFLLRHFRTLDFIPSVAALALPSSWRSGFHQYYRNTTYCFPGPFWGESVRYLRTAIPAYWSVCAVLLALEQLLIAAVACWRANRRLQRTARRSLLH